MVCDIKYTIFFIWKLILACFFCKLLFSVTIKSNRDPLKLRKAIANFEITRLPAVDLEKHLITGTTSVWHHYIHQHNVPDCYFHHATPSIMELGVVYSVEITSSSETWPFTLLNESLLMIS